MTTSSNIDTSNVVRKLILTTYPYLPVLAPTE